MKKLRKIVTALAAVLFALVALFHLSTYHPKAVQGERIYTRDGSALPSGQSGGPILKKGQTIKVLNWNLQYMAGKNYVFFYDEWDGSGKDTRPSREDIEATYKEVVRILLAEDPDVLVLQELHDGSASTDKEKQLERLVAMLPADYAYYTSAFYWKAAFVPHPRIMGSAGMKLAIISKYRIEEAIRYQLPLMPADPITRQLNFKRAVLEARLPVEGGSALSLMSIHMDAFAQGSDIMQKQVDYVLGLLDKTAEEGRTFAIAGDFNLVPPGASYSRLPDDEKPMFQPDTEIARLYERFKGYPRVEDVDGPEGNAFLTHFPNIRSAPDRVLDYYFVSDDIVPASFYVRQHDTLRISDHLPTILEFSLP